jgi:photosystem II stability/assembly factor-like uncharacterized protein
VLLSEALISRARLSWSVGAVVLMTIAAAVSGCRLLGAASPAAIGSPTGSVSTASAIGPTHQIISESLALDGSGWVVDAQGRLFLSGDGGYTWTDLHPPVQPSGTAMAGDEVVVAHVASIDETNWDAGHELQIAYSHDRGATWSKASVTLPIATEDRPSVSVRGTTVAILVPWGTSLNFSVGQLVFSADEKDWTLRDAPVAGNVALISSDEVWLAGGVGNAELYGTADGGVTWRRAALPNVAASFSVDTPVAVDGLSRDLVVTVPGDQTTAVLLTSQDAGLTWARATSVTVAGGSDSGVRVAAVLDAGQWRVPTLVSPTVVMTLDASPKSKAADGLPGVIMDWSMAEKGLGWAAVSVASCPTKVDCSSALVLMRTVDDGVTWESVGK